MVKVTHSSIENVSQIINSHNKLFTETNDTSTAPSNCRDKNNHSINGNCRIENVVDKCFVSVTEKSKEHVYIDIAEVDWK